jgi:hypothetical protein
VEETMEASSLLADYPPAPWSFEGSIGISLQLHSRKGQSALLPPFVEPKWCFGRRVAGVSIWGHLHYSETSQDDKAFDLALFLSGPVEHGSHSGWWTESAIVGHPGMYGGLKNIWAFPASLASTFFRGDRPRGQFEFDMGTRFFAEAGFQRLLPAWEQNRTFSLWTLKDQRLHQARLTVSGRGNPALGGYRLSRNRILPQLHGLNVVSLWIPHGLMALEAPEDIDLRGYKPAGNTSGN